MAQILSSSRTGHQHTLFTSQWIRWSTAKKTGHGVCAQQHGDGHDEIHLDWQILVPDADCEFW